jgi:hypothetical protein
MVARLYSHRPLWHPRLHLEPYAPWHSSGPPSCKLSVDQLHLILWTHEANSRSWNISYPDISTRSHSWLEMAVRETTIENYGCLLCIFYFLNLIPPKACRNYPAWNYTFQTIPISTAMDMFHCTWLLSRPSAPSPTALTTDASHVPENHDEHELKYPANKRLWGILPVFKAVNPH